jgi:hypothetical protein
MTLLIAKHPGIVIPIRHTDELAIGVRDDQTVATVRPGPPQMRGIRPAFRPRLRASHERAVHRPDGVDEQSAESPGVREAEIVGAIPDLAMKSAAAASQTSRRPRCNWTIDIGAHVAAC